MIAPPICSAGPKIPDDYRPEQMKVIKNYLWLAGTVSSPGYSIVGSELRQITTLEVEEMTPYGKSCRASDLLLLAGFHYARHEKRRCLQALEAASLFDPLDSRVENARGVMLHAMNCRAGARNAFIQALKWRPHYRYAELNLAQMLVEDGKGSSAIPKLIELGGISCVSGAAFLSLCTVWKKVGILDQALQCARKAIEILPENGHAHLLYATILADMGQTGEAINKLQSVDPVLLEARYIFPHYVQVLRKLKQNDVLDELSGRVSRTRANKHCLGNELISRARANANRAEWRREAKRAFVGNRLDPYLRALRALALMELGRIEEAFAYYEWRVTGPSKKGTIRKAITRLSLPHWDGHVRKGSRILVHGEQGVGDQVMFSSFLIYAFQTDQRFIVSVDKRLLPIYRRSYPGQRFVPLARPFEKDFHREAVEYQILIGSLGKYYGSRLLNNRTSTSYLAVNQHASSTLRRKYEKLAGGRLIVGLSWFSSHAKLSDTKNPPVVEWRPILEVPGVFFVNLQYGDQAYSMVPVAQESGAGLYKDEYIDQMQDMEGFFSQVAAMDLVITISNTTLHVAGAIGKKLYFIKAADLPLMSGVVLEKKLFWYPHAEVITKTAKSGWDRTLKCVARRLRTVLRDATSGRKAGAS